MYVRRATLVSCAAIAILPAMAGSCGGDEFSADQVQHDGGGPPQDATGADQDAASPPPQDAAPTDTAPTDTASAKDGPSAEAEAGLPGKLGVGQECGAPEECAPGAVCNGNRCSVSLTFDDQGMAGWETSQPGADGGYDSRAVVLDGMLHLEVFKCNDVSASYALPQPTEKTTVTVEFDWQADAKSSWWENPGWRLTAGGKEVAAGGLGLSQTQHPSTGQVSQTAEIDGAPVLEFYIHKDQNCWQADHSYTWLRIDNVKIH